MITSNAIRTGLNRIRLVVVFAISFLMLPAWAESVPDLVLDTGNGKPVSLQSLRGKVVYLDFWASWCAPCRQSFPWMQEMQSRYGERGLVVVAVNVDREHAEASRFLTETPVTFVIGYDPEGNAARTMQIKGMPSSFLIGRDGSIVSRHIGFRESDRKPRETEIQALLAQ